MNTSTLALKPIAIGNTTVSEHLPGLREKFLAPEANLALVRYDGMLGVREITDAMLLTWKGRHVAFELPVDAQKEFRGLCESLLDTRFPEWSEAEGAEGRFVWDLSSDTLMHDHSLRFLAEYEATEGVAESGSDEVPESEFPF